MTTEAAPSQRLEAIVLAGGSGTRFGGGKLLAPWRGGLLIHGALEVAFDAPVQRIHLVWGADPAVAAAGMAFAQARDGVGRLRLVEATDHAEGMGASLRAGARRLDEACGGVFVFLADMPLIPRDIAPRLAAALDAGAPAAAPWCGPRRGHPVLFGRDLLTSLATAAGDAGAREILAQLGDRAARVEADPGVLFDVDRPEDLDRA